MPDYLYYLILAVIGLAIAVFVIYKEKQYYKLITFFLFSATLADLGEVLVLLILDGYSYKLGVFSDPLADSILTHLILNNTLWPAIAIFIAAYSPRLRWIILTSFIFILLDILYVHLGVYQHNWWQSWMSGLAIFIYCIFMRFWYSRLDHNKFLRFMTFSSVFTLFMLLPSVLLLLAGKEFYRIGIFGNVYKDSIVFSLFYYAVISPLCVLFICQLKKWFWKLIPFALILLGDYILMVLGILNFINGWNLYHLTLVRTICVLIFLLLENKYSYKPK
jgi:hypothetical protein